MSESVMEGIALTGLDGIVTEANEKAVRMFGCRSEDELLGKNALDLIAQRDCRRAAADMQEVRKQGAVRYIDCSLVKADGSEYPAEIRASMKRDASGNSVGLIEIIRDVTERKRAEDQLRLEAQLLDCVSDSVFLHDFEGSCFYANESAYKSRGYSKDKLMGMNLRALDSPKYRRTIQKRDRDLMKRGQATYESAHVRKDQSLMPVEVQARIVESGGRKLILSVARDITERKRGQEKFQRSYEKLQRTMEGMTLAFELATEMRDPYTSGHQRRATKLACAIAREMGVAKERVEGIHVAGSVHDVGKMYVPSEILAKPAPLTEAEFCLIKVHPKVGHDILRTAEAEWPVAEIMLQHHERMDGSGYPSGLSGEDILLEARILAVADVVEAMSSHRPYRPAYPIDKALLEIMQKKDVLYDCNAVDACLSLFTEKGFKFD